ncbi:putative alpha/beta superfamily hydrolase [Brevundimonas nasdae]|uniref:alpha/beta hydrolase n=1 Tax=Brevundimonas nasdae TaxID=172043 RepID=UPI00191441C1|nr:alpha/beta hydrolase-fold protein [Brevundimonas nasdae]MBK6024065.1 alpha/beta hydrolase [Brevundimonas nasdae]MDQ0450721.1 putative alpha/beta superfamily hydrolase [Brevundimonas nasdae]
MKRSGPAVALMAVLAAACSPKADAQSSPQTAAQAQAAQAEGAPYVLKGTQVWTVPDPVSGRDYEVFVSLPASYEANPQRRYPVLYVTDADYAFPIIRQVARRVNLDGPRLEEFILVGLSYSRGDSGVVSRNRDYTPTPNGPRSASSNVHGQGAAYQTYLKNEVLPFIDNRFRADPARRVLLGHSYGGLLGAQILFTDPSMFQAYVLGSPSFWFDKRHIMTMEAAYARSHTDLPANVFMYVGDWEVPGPSPRNTSGANLVRDMQTMETTLKSHHYPNLRVQSLVLTDEDHLTVAPVGFTRGLLAVLPAK